VHTQFGANIIGLFTLLVLAGNLVAFVRYLKVNNRIANAASEQAEGLSKPFSFCIWQKDKVGIGVLPH
jgi:hypothetical protein